MAAMRPDRRGLEPTAGTCHNAASPRPAAMTMSTNARGLVAGSVPANTERQRKPRACRGFQGVDQKSRDQGALDAAILSQSRKAQHCYLAMAAMRPDPSRPRDGLGRVICTGECGYGADDQLTNA